MMELSVSYDKELKECSDDDKEMNKECSNSLAIEGNRTPPPAHDTSIQSSHEDIHERELNLAWSSSFGIFAVISAIVSTVLVCIWCTGDIFSTNGFIPSPNWNTQPLACKYKSWAYHCSIMSMMSLILLQGTPYCLLRDFSFAWLWVSCRIHLTTPATMIRTLENCYMFCWWSVR